MSYVNRSARWRSGRPREALIRCAQAYAATLAARRASSPPREGLLGPVALQPEEVVLELANHPFDEVLALARRPTATHLRPSSPSVVLLGVAATSAPYSSSQRRPAPTPPLPSPSCRLGVRPRGGLGL